MPVERLQAIGGVPESALDDETARTLPPGVPAAPWDVVADAVVWWHRALPSAAAWLPEPLQGRRVLPVTIAAFVRYRETPVGPYDEVLASPLLLAELPLPAGSVRFIAVDSLASIRGGRANWALPKTFARFAFARGSARADGPGWSVAAAVRARPRPVPLGGAARARQPGAGAFEVRVRGTARLGSVDVTAQGPTLPAWLRAGRHPAVVVTGARMRVGAPR